MVTRVLVVDDSGFFRRRIVEILEADPGLKVIGTAANGQEAIDQVAVLKPDVITMDIEMPVMDGITAVRHIMQSNPLPILMFSSLTHDGARATLDALEAGAVDFLPKRFEDIAKDREEARMLLCRRIRDVVKPASGSIRARPAKRITSALPVTRVRAPVAKKRDDYRIVAIASSTGGPVALAQVLSRLPASFNLPLVVVQHMPASFTPAFAARLDQQCAIKVKEAEDGDIVRGGQVLLAPGGRQMTLKQQAGEVRVVISDGDASLHYKPCADVTFDSVASVFGGRVLAVVLTGMGADGREGVRTLKAQGSTVWSQDEETSVIYGMPMAVAEAGLSDQVMALRDIGPGIAQATGA
ncbi:two-component system chemotaxis response regulator CheB [Thiogranum longum]|uniref:Protein-glutamate methylesterase/protein-glutamine glutaminase n=1 Tax=Thiogranum longum TaxID=1537524 RepID=A0A4R1HDV4_9GAMM|nr:chemotaxis response regulator protein-glutamate methylesterase [Thiogranum longum]TCK18823.1 two-component system chemotaxis response regulator CheB [Thiogranum longum]